MAELISIRVARTEASRCSGCKEQAWERRPPLLPIYQEEMKGMAVGSPPDTNAGDERYSVNDMNEEVKKMQINHSPPFFAIDRS